MKVPNRTKKTRTALSIARSDNMPSAILYIYLSTAHEGKGVWKQVDSEEVEGVSRVEIINCHLRVFSIFSSRSSVMKLVAKKEVTKQTKRER